MTYGQLALNRYVLEQLKEGKTPSISDSQKVDLDYLANNFDNVISDIEKDMKKKPKQKEFAFVIRVSKD